MVKLKVKTELIKRLKELGVYDEWLLNVKRQWDETKNHSGAGVRCTISELEHCETVSDLIFKSFNWVLASRGREFWRNIK